MVCRWALVCGSDLGALVYITFPTVGPEPTHAPTLL